MALWNVELVGSSTELGILAQHFPEPAPQAIKVIEETYYLISDTFAGLADAGQVNQQTREDILPSMKALMKVRGSDCSSVTVGAVIKLNDNGSRSVSRFVLGSAVLSANAGLSIQAMVFNPDGTIKPSAEAAISTSRLQLAAQDANVKDALHFWNAYEAGSDTAWVNLFKVYDIIEADMGGGTTRAARRQGQEEIEHHKKWATEVEIKGFRESANNPHVSGEIARHSASWIVPTGVVPLMEAESFLLIRRLLNSWLDFKSKATPLSP